MSYKFLEDSNGDKSSLRLVWTASVLAIVGVWAFVSIKTLCIQTIDIGTAVAFMGLLGSKVAQRWIENKKE